MAAIPSENHGKTTAAQAVDYRFLAENCADILSRIGVDGVIHYISSTCMDVLGWKPEEWIGRKFGEFVFAEDLSVFDESAFSCRANGAANFQATVRLRKKDRSYIWIHIHGRCARDPADSYVLSMRDISDRKAIEKRLSTLAMTDTLTGLGNRRAFDQALRQEWKRAVRDRSQLALILLDLDHFKPLNDRYGHFLGDECLVAVASATRNAVRTSDLVCRWGGDEIAIILPDTGQDGAVKVAEKVRASIEELRLQAREGSEECVAVTASIGVATAMAAAETAATTQRNLLQAADKALYRAKQEGQNRVVRAPLIGCEAG